MSQLEDLRISHHAVFVGPLPYHIKIIPTQNTIPNPIEFEIHLIICYNYLIYLDHMAHRQQTSQIGFQSYNRLFFLTMIVELDFPSAAYPVHPDNVIPGSSSKA